MQCFEEVKNFRSMLSKLQRKFQFNLIINSQSKYNGR
jgi:hypothetical protein